MAPLARTLGCAQPSETVAEAISHETLLICSLDGDRNHSKRPRFVVRCFAAPGNQLPTDNVAQSGNDWAFVEPRPVCPVEFLELAWIVRKKRIWSTS